MSAFASLILLIFIAALAMSAVAYANYKVERVKKVKQRLQKLRVRVEELEDVVLALDQLCTNRMIPKIVNDEVIDIYQQMIDIDPQASYLKAGYSNAKMRSEELSNETADRHISRLCNSDAQIARLQAYLNETVIIIRKQHNQGKTSTTEMQSFILEVEWLYLQVDVISNIAEGHKAYGRQDILTANAFYKKAQTGLMSSNHPDERRQQMIKQLSDIIFGRRKALDLSLMPEDEFNPHNTIEAALTEDEQKLVEKMLLDGNASTAEMPDIINSIIAQKTHGHNPLVDQATMRAH